MQTTNRLQQKTNKKRKEKGIVIIFHMSRGPPKAA